MAKERGEVGIGLFVVDNEAGVDRDDVLAPAALVDRIDGVAVAADPGAFLEHRDLVVYGNTQTSAVHHIFLVPFGTPAFPSV